VVLPAWVQSGIDIGRGVVGQLDAPSVSVFWGYLASAAVIAFAVYVRRRPDARPSVGGFVRFVVPPSEARGRAWHDVAIFAVNTVLYSLLFLPTIQAVSSAVGQHTWLQLHEALGPIQEPLTGAGPRVGMTIAVVVLADIAFFVSHWVQHRVPVLWEFHKVHHSAETLTPFTVFRRHPVDVLVESLLSGVLLGALYGVSGWLSGGALDGYTILGVNVVLFLFLVLGFNLQHSHVWLSFGPLDRVFVSPATHQIHHSTDPRHFGKNYGNVFALWDGLAGTLVRPREFAPLQFGLGTDGDPRDRTLLGLYVGPIVRAVRRLWPSARAR
jgi:sterol desaturase/sphingolipid hydroxylase (fatty acid hydroxylase superfamily)